MKGEGSPVDRDFSKTKKNPPTQPAGLSQGPSAPPFSLYHPVTASESTRDILRTSSLLFSINSPFRKFRFLLGFEARVWKGTLPSQPPTAGPMILFHSVSPAL